MCVPALMLGDLTFVLGLKRNFDSLDQKQVSMKMESNNEEVWFFYLSMHIITLPKKKDILDRSHKFQSSPFQIQMWYRKMRNNVKRIKMQKRSGFAVKAYLIFLILTPKNSEACRLHTQKCIYLPNETIFIFRLKNAHNLVAWLTNSGK